MIVPRPNHHVIENRKWAIGNIIVNNPASIEINSIMNRINDILKNSIGQSVILNISLDETLKGYELKINDEITLRGKNTQNIHYGLVSLLQLLLENNEIKEQHIIDSPRFRWRGVMVDVSRHFFGKETVFQIIDLMFLHKLNVLHLHLSDDHGFRVESKKFPLLTQISTKRQGSTFNKNNSNCKEYKGYYSQQEILEIVEYANLHHIKVVPEIDIPGHITAVLAAYPNLSCREREKRVATGYGYYTDSLCMSNPGKVDFMLDIIEEIIQLFPDKIVHLGGDEVSLKHANNCPSCQRSISDNGGDPHILFKMLFDRARNRFNSQGYTTITWSDIWQDIDPSGENHYTQMWMDLRHEDMFRKIPNNSLYCINSNVSYFYGDYSYRSVEMKGTYSYDIADGVENGKYILGSELALWTELISDRTSLFKHLLPRLSAFSENLWTQKNTKNYRAFLKNRRHMMKLYEMAGISEYTPFNKTSARIFRGNKLAFFRLALFGIKRMGITNAIRYAKTGELQLNDPSMD